MDDTNPENVAKMIRRLTILEEDERKEEVANMDVGEGTSTDTAETFLIMDRLCDLYKSLSSRPSVTQLDKQPSCIKSTLMPHQLHALSWLKWRETQNPSGGLLADDMGLGKTYTMLALIAADRDKRIENDSEEESEESNEESEEDRNDNSDGGRPSSKLARGGTLVVCPASLIQQWSNEVSRHCNEGALSVCVHHGSARTTHAHRLAANDIVVTTYNLLQRDNKKGILQRVQWRRVILDEAHIVRNYKSATSAGVCALSARSRWCLTGTPVHNNDLDLYALIKFLRCAPFNNLEIWKRWIDNRSQVGQERLNIMMQIILLRRTKLQLQELGQLTGLPECTAHNCLVTLSSNEMSVYEKVMGFSKTLFEQFLRKQNLNHLKIYETMIAMYGEKRVKPHEILVLLLRLRQACCHCGLIASVLDYKDCKAVEEDPSTKDLLGELRKLSMEDSKNKKKKLFKNKSKNVDSTTVAEAIRSIVSPDDPVFDLKCVSSKIQAVMECLNENVFSNKDHKAVVVSQWTSVLRLVEQQLKKAGVRSVLLNGQVPTLARLDLVDALNNPSSGVKVMLLSLTAGGIGLNLKGANHLLLIDPHWNPQLEEQAQGRIYRIGQNKPVHIYRFMCVDTVEQAIRKIQEEKLALAANILTRERDIKHAQLSVEDLKMLFHWSAHSEKATC